jgi:hypothetical protein
MSIARRNSRTPPAMRNAPSEMPSTRKMSPPMAPKDARTMPAAKAARNAVRRLCSDESVSVIDKKRGTAAGASTTSRSVVTVERLKERTCASTPRS